ncbi:MAG TPA: hypothetical protein PLJ26_00085 [Candidatus Omnitrophota bacterium]|nr:hypothetical protein [Candidatus Omnitrophota bacterium]
MNRAIMIIATAFIAAGTAACAYALEMKVLPVPGPGATCTTSDPAEPAMGKAQTISVSAKVLSTVSVKLSATKIDWKVTSAGTYKHPCINIYVGSQNGHDVIMSVAGAADLASGGGKKSIPTTA